MVDLPPGWTETTVTSYELRRGDPTTIIKFNIGRLGLGSSADMRDWLLNEGYKIDKEWWEQNEFYVIRIWGTISPTWFEWKWGPPRKTVLEPPREPYVYEPPKPPGRPPIQPIPQPPQNPDNPCRPTPTQPPKKPVGPEPIFDWPDPEDISPPASVINMINNFLFAPFGYITAYTNFYFPTDTFGSLKYFEDMLKGHNEDANGFFKLVQRSWAGYLKAGNEASDILSFVLAFMFGGYQPTLG